MSVRIEPPTETHFERLHELFDAVCKERRFLAFTEAGPREQTYAYYRNVVAGGHSHFVAVQEQRLLGWCDVLPLRSNARTRGCPGHGSSSE